MRGLRDDWNRLASECPLHSWEWLSSWSEVYVPDQELLVGIVRDNADRVVGIVPWYRSTSRTGASIIRHLGSGQACSDYARILCDDSHREPIERFVANSLLQAGPASRQLGRWDQIEIEGHDSSAYRFFFQAAERLNVRLHQEPLAGTWVTELEDSFEGFRHGLHRSFRRKVGKAQRRIASGVVELQFIRDVPGIQAIWPSFCRLHQKRRQSMGQPGCFADPDFERFLFDATCRLAQQNQVLISHAIRTDNERTDIGFLLIFQSAGSCYQYQSGMLPQAGDLEPGHLMIGGTIQQAIEEGKTSFDFLRGDEPYKRFWKTVRCPLFRSRLIAPKATSLLRHQIWLTARTIKHRWEGCSEP